MKSCTKCHITKPLDQFYARRERKAGYRSECKQCCSKRTTAEGRLRDRQYEHLHKKIYRGQKGTAKRRDMAPPDYTSAGLAAWLEAQPQFKVLYDTWVASGYDKGLRPSCDRLDDYKSYTLDNLQLGTWDDNREHYFKAVHDGVTTKQCRKVFQYARTGEFIQTFHSAQAAKRSTGIDASSILKTCKGRYKTSGGYVWKFN